MQDNELELITTGVISGDRTWVSKAITLVESSSTSDLRLLTIFLKSFRHEQEQLSEWGLPALPELGKAFIDELGSYLTSRGTELLCLQSIRQVQFLEAQY